MVVVGDYLDVCSLGSEQDQTFPSCLTSTNYSSRREFFFKERFKFICHERETGKTYFSLDEEFCSVYFFLVQSGHENQLLISLAFLPIKPSRVEALL